MENIKEILENTPMAKTDDGVFIREYLISSTGFDAGEASTLSKAFVKCKKALDERNAYMTQNDTDFMAYIRFTDRDGQSKDQMLYGMSLERIFNQICKYYYIENKSEYKKLEKFIEAVKSKNRLTELVKVRQVYSYIAIKYTNNSQKKIGKLIGNRDHSTIIHGNNAIKNSLHFINGRQVDKALGLEINRLTDYIILGK